MNISVNDLEGFLKNFLRDNLIGLQATVSCNDHLGLSMLDPGAQLVGSESWNY